MSVKSHLTFGASVRPKNTVTYSAGNRGQKICGFSLKLLRYRDPALPPLKPICTVGHFLQKARIHIIVLDSQYVPRGGTEGSALYCIHFIISGFLQVKMTSGLDSVVQARNLTPVSLMIMER